MKVSITLKGKKQEPYSIMFSEMGDEVGGGILVELINDKTKKIIASANQPSGGIGGRLLSNWFAKEQKATQ